MIGVLFVICGTWDLATHLLKNGLILIKSFLLLKFQNPLYLVILAFMPNKNRLLFLLSLSVSINSFDLVHMNIWGPLSTTSLSRFKYFLIVVDDKSRFTWIYLMKLKYETSILTKNFLTMVHTQFNIKIKCIRSDNGNEFKLTNFYHEHRILHLNSFVGTPQQMEFLRENINSLLHT